MNIFMTSIDPRRCATALDDKRLVKAVLETAQLLSTALHTHHVNDNQLYRATHQAHPATIWVKEYLGNYNWTLRYFEALSTEYTLRFDRMHKSEQLWEWFIYYRPIIPPGKMTMFSGCTPGITEPVNDVFARYQKYLNLKWRNDRTRPKWTNRKLPYFYGKEIT